MNDGRLALHMAARECASNATLVVQRLAQMAHGPKMVEKNSLPTVVTATGMTVLHYVAAAASFGVAIRRIVGSFAKMASGKRLERLVASALGRLAGFWVLAVEVVHDSPWGRD